MSIKRVLILLDIQLTPDHNSFQFPHNKVQRVARFPAAAYAEKWPLHQSLFLTTLEQFHNHPHLCGLGVQTRTTLIRLTNKLNSRNLNTQSISLRRTSLCPLHRKQLLGSNNPNTIPDPTWIRCSRFCIVLYVSTWTPFLFGLSYDLCFSQTLYFPVTFSHDS